MVNISMISISIALDYLDNQFIKNFMNIKVFLLTYKKILKINFFLNFSNFFVMYSIH